MPDFKQLMATMEGAKQKARLKLGDVILVEGYTCKGGQGT